MKYSFFIQNNSLIITDEQRVILSGIKIRINYLRSKNILYIPRCIEVSGNTTTVKFERNEPRGWMAEAAYVQLIFTEEAGALLAKANFACTTESHAYNFTYPAFDSAFIDYTIPEEKDGMLNLHSQIPYWMTPSFVNDANNFQAEVDCLSCKIKDRHIYLLPLVNNDVTAYIEKTGLVINTGVADKFKILADVFMIASADDPFTAIGNCFTSGRALNAITTPPFPSANIQKNLKALVGVPGTPFIPTFHLIKYIRSWKNSNQRVLKSSGFW